MQRVAVVGASGSGKTTLARALAVEVGVPHVELDEVHHGPDWTALPREAFRRHMAEVVEGDGWVVDGNYRAVRDLVWARADTVVWLDLPRRTTVRRVAVRTLRRAVTREVLWHGNQEALRNLVRRDPERNILLWAWVKQPLLVEQLEAATVDPANAHLDVVRLRSARQVRRWRPAPAGRRGRRR